MIFQAGDSDLDQKNTQENADLPIKDVEGSETYDETCLEAVPSRFLAGKPSILQNIFLGHRYEEPTGAFLKKNRAETDDQPPKNQWRRLAIRRFVLRRKIHTQSILILSVDQYTL